MADNNFGNTISVGSLNELAGIIANFTPEQLQTIQLDPSLYEALSKSVESTSVQLQQSQNQEIAGLPQAQFLTLPNDNPLQNSANVIVNQPIPNNGVLSSLGEVQMADVDSSTNINNIELITTLHGDPAESNFVSPIKANYSVAANNLVMQPQEQQQASILTIDESVLPVVTQVVPDQTLVIHNVNEVAGLQGILPGEGSSMITHLTPTLMSQVQPTATIQTINITDAQLMHHDPTQTTSFNSADSFINLSSTPLQNQQLATQATSFATQATSFGVDQSQLIQLPIVPTSAVIPSTITIDQSLLKTNNDALSLNNQAPVMQNVSTSANNKCILVDGNIISGNTIVGQVITSGNVPVQPILMTDVNTNVLLSGIPPTITHLSSVESSINSGNLSTNALLPSISTASLVKNVQVTQSKKQQQNVLKKPKTIQSISNFTPNSSVFNNNNASKATKFSGTTTISSNASKTTPARNVIIKKTINVIKKSENTVVPMKPTSVEQVQPGVFKFQLKKVDSSEAESLLQTNLEIPTTTAATTTEQRKTYHVTIPSKSSHRNKSPDDTQLKIPSTRIVIPALDSKPKNNNSSLKSTTTQCSLASKSGSIASRMKMPFNSPATISGTSKAPSKSGTVVQQQHKHKQGGTTSNTSSSVTSVKSITVPRSLLSKLKGKMTDGNVLKITDTALLNELLAFSKSPKKSDVDATRTYSSTVSGASMRQLTTTTKSTSTTKSTNCNASQNTKNPPGRVPSSSSKQLTATSGKQLVQPASRDFVSPEKIFIPAPTTKATPLPTIKATTLPTTKGTTLPTTKGTTLPTTKGTTLPTTKGTTLSITKVSTLPTTDAKPSMTVSMKKKASSKQIDSSLDEDLQCKEDGFLSPTATTITASRMDNSSQQGNKQLKNPLLVLNKLEPPDNFEESSQEEELSQDELSSREDSDEVKTMRAAIKSSRVGEQEKQMRDLARQEIENQLKRFGQKEKKDSKLESKKEIAKPESKSPALVKKSTISPPNKRKNPNGVSVSSSDKNDSNQKSSENDDVLESRTPRKKLKVINNSTEQESRKRGRPKKYDDFVLASKSKKEKKTRKFFFPKDTSIDEMADASETETSLQGDLPASPQQNDVVNTDNKTDMSAEKKEANLPKKNTKTQNKKTIKTKKYKKRKNKPIAFEAATLPDHLKAKPKSKYEDAVIDLSKVKLRSAFAETTYNLDDSVNWKTYKLLQRKTWLCTLCGKPGNLGSLDVLFGPYKITVRHENASNTSDTRMSVWLHRDCAIWTSSICLSNQKLCGLGDSLDEAAVTKCCLCSQVGATLQCGLKQCRDGYHFVCAKQRGCSFQMENFTITCPKHR